MPISHERKGKICLSDNILITGSTGFVGHRLLNVLHGQYHNIRVVRRRDDCGHSFCEFCTVGDIDIKTDWFRALKDIDIVIHLAARVHVMDDPVMEPLVEFRKVNVDGTLNLADQAAREGVRRFIFMSSIKVNGEKTRRNIPFTESDAPEPSDAYAISKYEAEQGLLRIAEETGMEVVIIRPPLVYGPEVKANFLKMMRWLYRGIPLPLGAINNKRSLIALDNLVNLIMVCMEHPAAANRVFLAADGKDLSTTELLKKLGHFLGKPARLIPVPRGILEAGLKMAGKSDMADRLCGSLQVDISKTKQLLGWRPPVTVDEGLAKTARWFLETR